MSAPSILTEIKNKVLWVTLNRPEKFNSFNREMALGLIVALDQAANDETIRAVVLTGNGKAFCAGQDLAEAVDPDGPGIEKIVTEHYNPIILKIRALQKPVIAAVNGVAAGAGANIALCCDIVYVAKSASFIQAFSKIGLVPDSGGTFTLPRLVGFNLASALMITGDKVTANEAVQYGMAYKMFDDDLLIAQTLENAEHIANMPTHAIALTKQLLNASANNTLQNQLEMEKENQILAADSIDYKEGVRAFLEKSKPVFVGK